MRGTGLNGCVGDRLKAKITGGFRVLGENDNGRRVIDFCVGKGLYVGNTYFNHKSSHNYNKGARGRKEKR